MVETQQAGGSSTCRCKRRLIHSALPRSHSPVGRDPSLSGYTLQICGVAHQVAHMEGLRIDNCLDNLESKKKWELSCATGRVPVLPHKVHHIYAACIVYPIPCTVPSGGFGWEAKHVAQCKYSVNTV